MSARRYTQVFITGERKLLYSRTFTQKLFGKESYGKQTSLQIYKTIKYYETKPIQLNIYQDEVGDLELLNVGGFTLNFRIKVQD
ncbi:Uncharacterized protein HZ326_29784 [Fusarium oxysporum f. sp. albedinis]|nr:Uncharacterized protein HZ326_29784 [Fusarium oxysporum f. sp. albedinis]